MAQVFKNPIVQSDSLIPKRTLEDARKNTRWILANDTNNSVYEAYDEYLEKKGKPHLTKIAPNGETIYPKGSWRTIVSDDEWLQKEVLPYLTDDYGYDDDYDFEDVPDDIIEKSVSQYLGDSYK